MFRFLTIAVGISVALLASRAGAVETLRFALPVESDTAGLKKNQLVDTFKKLFASIEKKTGVKIILDEVPAYALGRKLGIYGHRVYNQEIMKRIKAKQVDVFLYNAEDYFLFPGFVEQTTPFASWTVAGKQYGSECLYVSPKSGIKSAANLKGKAIGGLTSYVTIRQMLAQKGVDMPLTKFFGQFNYEPNSEAAIKELYSGKSATTHLNHQLKFYLSGLNAQNRGLVPIACADNMPLYMVAHRKGINPKTLQTLGALLITADRDPSLAQIKWFFLAFRGKFFLLPPTYLDGFKKVIATAKAKGWVKEAEVWHNQQSPAFFKQWMKKNP